MKLTDQNGTTFMNLALPRPAFHHVRPALAAVLLAERRFTGSDDRIASLYAVLDEVFNDPETCGGPTSSSP